MTDTFEGQEGTAVYRTTEGDFEALFLPKPQNFNKLRVTSVLMVRTIATALRAAPDPWPANLMESTFPLYFVSIATS